MNDSYRHLQFIADLDMLSNTSLFRYDIGVAGNLLPSLYFIVMNKDALLATLIGFGIGLFITGMLLVGPKIVGFFPKISLDFSRFTTSKTSSKSTPTPQEKEFGITIDSPLTDSLESQDEVFVSGSTTAGATVVIAGNVNDAAIETKTDGKFAGKLTLVEGKNDITVTSYLKDKKASQTITVFYTPEEL